MKKTILLTMLMLMTCLAGNAQHFKNSRYYDSKTGSLNYNQRQGDTWSNRYRYHIDPYNYYGLRLGLNLGTVQSDDPWLAGGKTRSGLNIGAVMGISLSQYTPLYFETGLMYTEKGGKQGSGNNKITYALNYLEVPLLVKYMYSPDGHFAVQPYLGGYLACGVSGKIKNFHDRAAYNSFGDDMEGLPRFQRFDGGLKFGCGVSYDVLYADICYSYGLSNISHDYFDSSHNSVFSLNIGVNF